MEVETVTLHGFDLPSPTFAHKAAANLEMESLEIRSESSLAATRVQKVYRSYRTRRRLADSAVIVEELW